jgi:MFS family permease
VFTHFPKRLATVANFASQGNMAIVMVIIGLGLHDHGHTLAAISFAQAWHSIGMFGFSLPIGKVADSLGRKPVLFLGTVVESVGALLVALPSDYVAITLGGLLVGVGWSCVNIASTAIVADTSAPGERGRAIGAVDTFAGMAAIGLPLVAGPMAQGLGLASTGILAVALMVPPALMLLALHEARPGRYEQHAPSIP